MSIDPPSHTFALREELDAALVQRADFDAWPAELKQALAEHLRGDQFVLLRYHLLVGLGISAMALVWDLLVLPQKADVAIAWRLLTAVPLALIGLFVLRPGDSAKMKLLAALSLICVGVLAMHLASFGSPEVMSRYVMATSLILGLACLALPCTPREIKLFGLTFALATSIAGLWPHALPPGELALHIVFSTLIGAPAWAIARRHWNVRARSYLLDLRDDLTRQELEQNNEMLRQLSEQDPLTGMPNRRKFERVVAERLDGRRPDRAWPGRLALMMIDLDHFKAFNDRHGHQAGDRCLAMAAAQLQAVFPREYGVLARYGGEEFIAAVRERRPGEATELAERMRSAIAQLLVPVRDTSRSLITTSIGLALVPADTTLELDDMIEMADAALYSAKRAGRNRVEIVEAGDEPALRRRAGNGSADG